MEQQADQGGDVWQEQERLRLWKLVIEGLESGDGRADTLDDWAELRAIADCIVEPRTTS